MLLIPSSAYAAFDHVVDCPSTIPGVICETDGNITVTDVIHSTKFLNVEKTITFEDNAGCIPEDYKYDLDAGCKVVCDNNHSGIAVHVTGDDVELYHFEVKPGCDGGVVIADTADNFHMEVYEIGSTNDEVSAGLKIEADGATVINGRIQKSHGNFLITGNDNHIVGANLLKPRLNFPCIKDTGGNNSFTRVRCRFGGDVVITPTTCMHDSVRGQESEINENGPCDDWRTVCNGTSFGGGDGQCDYDPNGQDVNLQVLGVGSGEKLLLDPQGGGGWNNVTINVENVDIHGCGVVHGVAGVCGSQGVYQSKQIWEDAVIVTKPGVTITNVDMEQVPSLQPDTVERIIKVP